MLNKRHTDEGNLIGISMRAGSVKESGIFAQIRHNAALPVLGNHAGYPFPHTVLTQLLPPGLNAVRGFDCQRVTKQQGERSAHHSHALSQNTQNLVEQFLDILFMNYGRTDFLNHQKFR